MKKILIVDFLSQNRQRLISLLKMITNEQLIVIEADNGADAFTIATNQSPDLMITEVTLPQVNGFQLCREISTNQLTVNIPIITYTSLDDEFTAYWSRRDSPNVRDFIGKKNSNDDLLLTSIKNILFNFI